MPFYIYHLNWQKCKFHLVNVGDFPLLLRFVSQQSGFAFFGALTSVGALFYYVFFRGVILWQK